MAIQFPLFTLSRTGFGARLCSLALLLFASSTFAATLTVTNTNDSGAGSLRQAIADAASGDTIVFTVTGTITLTSGELAFSKSLAIQGPGSQLLTISGNNASRVFLITGGASSLSGLSIRNGSAGSTGFARFGGGILAFNCTLTISNCAITSNQAENAGGLFLGFGIFNLLNTTISGNTTEFQGSGINLQDATTTMNNCTISGNASQNTHGGILNLAAFRPASSLLLTNCTITNNTSIDPFGGAIWTAANSNAVRATTTLRNTLVANNSTRNFLTEPTTLVPAPNAVLISLGYNLDSDGTSGFVNGNNGNLVGTLANPLNALLGPLANNGGPTQTQALLPGSPAIDKGVNTGVATDQRGFTRTIDDPAIANAAGGDGTDIGAFELGATVAPTGTYTLCFAEASAWCHRLGFPGYQRNYHLTIPSINGGLSISPFGPYEFRVRQALGCGSTPLSVDDRLTAAYVAAQLSLQWQAPFWNTIASRQQLFFHVITPMAMPGMPAPVRALPATLSGGPVIFLTDNSSLQDLFTATNWALTRGTRVDQQRLLAIYNQLNTCRKD